MTILELYRKHKSGEISREKLLYEVRRDNNLPFITNLTSYDDAVKILKNKGIITEIDTKEAKADEAVKAEVKAKSSSVKKPKELHIDYTNPYEYRHGLQHELTELDEYTDEALEKAKTTVLKNLAKDANFYSNLLNAEKSSYTFKSPETDAPGMQAKADGYLKKEVEKKEKANVQDSLGKKEAGKKKPKDVKVMPDKGVTGSEKTIKEGLEEGLKKGDTVEYEGNKYKIGSFDTEANLVYLDTLDGKPAEDSKGSYLKVHKSKVKEINEDLEEGKKRVINKYINVEMEDGEELPVLNYQAVSDYLESVIDPKYIDDVDAFMDDNEGWGESSSYFFDTPDDTMATEEEVEDWAKQEMSYYLFSKPDEFPGKEMSEDININPINNDSSAEDRFIKLMDKYDWYAEMSDDPSKWNAQQAMEGILRQLATQIGADKAVELYNQYAPSNRKITTSHFMRENKHAKIKEVLKSALKKSLKEEDPQLLKLKKDEENAERSLAGILKKKADILNKPGTQG